MEAIKLQNGLDILKAYNDTEVKAKPVFGQYLYEGELGVLFGDSNAGKSILANDIAFFACGGGHEWNGMTSPDMPTMYIDMEMTARKFAGRYHNAGEYMTDKYTRAEVNALGMDEDKILPAIKAKIIYAQSFPTPPKFIIIDNITNGFGSILSGAQMRELVFDLKQFKDRFGLTILLIAHCPKRNVNKPITADSMGGSKMIINFVDSAFAIAPSVQGEDIRYIKQIKTREAAKDGQVMTVRIKDEPYLRMEVLDYTNEDVHINPKGNTTLYFEMTPEKEIALVRMLTDHVSLYEIERTLKIPFRIVKDYSFAVAYRS